MISFNIKNAMVLNNSPFKPLNVTTTEPLSELIELGHVLPEQQLLVVERDKGVVALDMKNMSYHHVAQGEINGEPWLVGF
jgi:hypothetical protein